jgi:crotonobetainyl-CoA:carnitine CoA-transferase CaiB-like acyl-CoA transferase
VKAALDGLIVLDASQLIAGPLAALYLADLGADVIKIEPPEGDKGRILGPVPVDEGRTTTFIAVNRNKRSVVLDLKTPNGQASLQTLLRRADIVITSARPDSAKRLGLSPDAIRNVNKNIITCAITGFGDTGPLSNEPALDYAVQARSGIMAISGYEEQPIRLAVTVIDISSAHIATQGILAALFHRERTGEGQHIDVALYDAALSLQVTPFSAYLRTARQPPRTGNATLLGAPADLFTTSDGFIVVNAYFPEQWLSLCSILQRRDLLEDARFKDNDSRLRHRKELFTMLSETFVKRTTDDWTRILSSGDIVASPICTYGDVEASEQTAVNQMIVEWSDPHSGPMRGLGYPLKMSQTPPQQRRSAPKLGEHTDEVLREFGVELKRLPQEVR